MKDCNLTNVRKHQIAENVFPKTHTVRAMKFATVDIVYVLSMLNRKRWESNSARLLVNANVNADSITVSMEDATVSVITRKSQNKLSSLVK